MIIIWCLFEYDHILHSCFCQIPEYFGKISFSNPPHHDHHHHHHHHHHSWERAAKINNSSHSIIDNLAFASAASTLSTTILAKSNKFINYVLYGYFQ